MTAHSPQNRSTQILFRVNPDEKEAFDECAKIAGISTSSWIRERLRLVATQEMANAGKVPQFLSQAPTDKDS